MCLHVENPIRMSQIYPIPPTGTVVPLLNRVYVDVEPESLSMEAGNGLGRQVWRAASPATAAVADLANSRNAFDASINPNASDLVLRSQLIRSNDLSVPLESDISEATTPTQSLIRGWSYWSRLQCKDGHWAGDYGGEKILAISTLLYCKWCMFACSPLQGQCFFSLVSSSLVISLVAMCSAPNAEAR